MLKEFFKNDVNRFVATVVVLGLFIMAYLQLNTYDFGWINKLYQIPAHFLLVFQKYTNFYLMNLLGHETKLYAYRMVHVEGTRGISIGNFCLALDVILWFIALILAYPKGSWKQKGIFFVIGFIGINLINVLRLAGLQFILIYKPEWADGSHRFIFNIVVIVFVFLIWMQYINRVGSFSGASKDE